jgi:predicted permease
MSWLRDDLTQAWRGLIRRPGFSALAILALAAGLGVNTVAFSAVNALLYKPFRFENADRSGWLFVGTRRDSLQTSTLATYEAMAGRSQTLERLAAQGRVPLAFRQGGATDEIWALVVSGDYFEIVPVTPLAGRVLGAGDGRDGQVPVLVSERFWRRRLSATPNLAALSIELNGHAAAVVGVVPDGHQGPGGVFEPDVWAPLAARDTLRYTARFEDEAAWLSFLARPAAGQTPEAVQTEVARLVAGTVDVAPGDELRVRYERFVDKHPEARGLEPIAEVGLVAVGTVLLIACFNVAGLMLARAVERRRDIGVRAALGASRWRLTRSLLTEGLLFAAISGVAALLLASWSASLLSAFSLPAPIPQRLHFVTDWRLVGYALLGSTLAALLPALAPMWQVARHDLAPWARAGQTAGGGTFGHRRTRRAFVVLQVAGSTLFLTTALMTAVAFRGVLDLDPGFDVDRTAVLTASPTTYGDTDAEALLTMREVAARVARQPGVEAVTVTDRAPFGIGAPPRIDASPDGRDCADGACTPLIVTHVDEHYFAASHRRTVAGRPWPTGASLDPLSVVVNESAAQRLWPAGSAIGQSFRDVTANRWRVVIAVVSDASLGMTAAEGPSVFLPFEDDTRIGSIAVVARHRDSAAAVVGPMREALQAVDPSVPIQSLQTMRERMALPTWMPRTILGFFSVCALLAVVLSTVGLFGVTYFAVNQRRREFGVRSALGATLGDVRRLVVGETVRLAAPGVVLGLVAAFGTVMVARATLPAVPALGPWPYVLAALIQVAVVLAAGLPPARRASSTSPIEVLRE